MDDDKNEIIKYKLLLKENSKDINILNKLGDLYYYGKINIGINYNLSIDYYRQAYSYGDFCALYKLGNMYLEGKGFRKCYKKAFDIYNEIINETNNNNQVVGSAMYKLGYMYENGKHVSKDFEIAIKYYKDAFEKGNEDAMIRLGKIYMEGIYVPINYSKALDCYKLASEKGIIMAMDQIGFMYEFGYGVKKNLLMAAEMYKKTRNMYAFTRMIQQTLDKGIGDPAIFIKLIIDLPEDMITDRELSKNIKNYKCIINYNTVEMTKLFLSAKKIPKDVIDNEIIDKI